ncbi:hypothetical protein [Dyadobacter sp. 676]|uniref:Uncharacterized protein n=1 Tax=Dyadobacter sp. 676 TaxID=3088362 RepID=A0AAU8FWI9_9BACT
MILKKIKNRVGYFTIILIFMGGIFYFLNHREYLDKSEYYELTRQLTPDKRYYIYHYARYGGMAFSSDITGYRLLEKEERFAENAGKKFPYGLGGWQSKDTILINELEQPGIDADTFPSRVEYETLGDFTIKRVFYKSSINGGRSMDYVCDSLYVSNGKIVILKIRDEEENLKLERMVFPLGPVTIYSNNGIVSKLEIEDLDKYYNSDNKAMVLSTSFTFIPNKSVLIRDLGETGYFLSIK